MARSSAATRANVAARRLSLNAARAEDHTQCMAQTSSQWHGPPRRAHSDVWIGPSSVSTISRIVMSSGALANR